MSSGVSGTPRSFAPPPIGARGSLGTARMVRGTRLALAPSALLLRVGSAAAGREGDGSDPPQRAQTVGAKRREGGVAALEPFFPGMG